MSEKKCLSHWRRTDIINKMPVEQHHVYFILFMQREWRTRPRPRSFIRITTGSGVVRKSSELQCTTTTTTTIIIIKSSPPHCTWTWQLPSGHSPYNIIVSDSTLHQVASAEYKKNMEFCDVHTSCQWLCSSTFLPKLIYSNLSWACRGHIFFASSRLRSTRVCNMPQLYKFHIFDSAQSGVLNERMNMENTRRRNGR